MALRKGHCYSKLERPYTRKSKVKSKSYIKAIPQSKISKFVMGNLQDYYANKFNTCVSLVSSQEIQIRDNAIEASRILVLRELTERVKNFCFLLSCYPHHVLREHKMLTGVGADRMQSGMKHSFGKPVSLAAQLRRGSKVFSVYCMSEEVEKVREILKKATTKFPGKYKIIVEKINTK
ncbi:MAG: 50S ribosomal protein L16 [Candidatus Pacearchaeota archaeon]|nr:50S ribosomal protein L16 [Candidatus Pacearchaeota archaeon]